MILVTGGTGFVGQALIRHLTDLGKPVRILLRPSTKSPGLPKGIPIDAAVCSLKDERGLRAAMKGVDVVYHLAGSENAGSRADLNGVDVDGTQLVAQSAAASGVERMIFLSHLGADRFSAYPVFRAKALAENAMIESGVRYTIFRTAPVFGPNDHFTNSLAQLLAASPGFFLMPGNGKAVLQPLWIEDLVATLTWTLGEPKTENQLYSIGGAEYLSFREVVDAILQKIHLRRRLVVFPPAYLRLIALFVEQATRHFPVSIYWLDYLAADRTCPLDTLPRLLGLMPARLTHHLDHLNAFAKR